MADAIAQGTGSKFTSFASLLSVLSRRVSQPGLPRAALYRQFPVGLSLLITAFITKLWWLIPGGIVQGRGVGLGGHFGFEKTSRRASSSRCKFHSWATKSCVPAADRQHQTARAGAAVSHYGADFIAAMLQR